MRTFLYALLICFSLSLQPAQAAPVEHTFCFAAHNGANFVIAWDDKKTVDAKSGQCKPWEIHTVIDLDGGFLISGDKVAIKTHFGRYWTAHKDGRLTGHVDYIREWETFTIHKVLPDLKTKPLPEVDKRRLFGIALGDRVGFRGHHGTWVQAVDGGGKAMNVTGKKLDIRETFTLFNPACDPSCDKQYDACMSRVYSNMGFSVNSQQYFLKGRFECGEARNTCKKVCRQ